jgi:hypothetical protein
MPKKLSECVTILNLRAALAQKNLATVAIFTPYFIIILGSFLNRVKLFPISHSLDIFHNGEKKTPQNLYSFQICVCID